MVANWIVGLLPLVLGGGSAWLFGLRLRPSHDVLRATNRELRLMVKALSEDLRDAERRLQEGDQ